MKQRPMGKVLLYVVTGNVDEFSIEGNKGIHEVKACDRN